MLRAAMTAGFPLLIGKDAVEATGEYGSVMDNPDVSPAEKARLGTHAVLSPLLAGFAGAGVRELTKARKLLPRRDSMAEAAAAAPLPPNWRFLPAAAPLPAAKINPAYADFNALLDEFSGKSGVLLIDAAPATQQTPAARIKDSIGSALSSTQITFFQGDE